MLLFKASKFLDQPRPDQAVSPGAFRFYENLGWIGQAKKNGTANQVDVLPDRSTVWRTRHNTPHCLWAPTPKSLAAFQAVAGTGIHKFVTEVLHSKTKLVDGGIKDTNFIHDVLVWNGKFLYDWTYQDRYDLLCDVFVKGGEQETIDHIKIDKHTWLAKNHRGPLQTFMDSLDELEDEGIVLKDPAARLAFCTRAGANSSWQRKSRWPTKNVRT